MPQGNPCALKTLPGEVVPNQLFVGWRDSRIINVQMTLQAEVGRSLAGTAAAWGSDPGPGWGQVPEQVREQDS